MRSCLHPFFFTIALLSLSTNQYDMVLTFIQSGDCLGSNILTLPSLHTVARYLPSGLHPTQNTYKGR